MITFFFFACLFCAFVIGLLADESEPIILLPIGLLLILICIVVPNIDKSTKTIKIKNLEDNTIYHIESSNSYSTNDTIWVNIKDEKIDPNSPFASKYIVLETIKTE